MFLLVLVGSDTFFRCWKQRDSAIQVAHVFVHDDRASVGPLGSLALCFRLSHRIIVCFGSHVLAECKKKKKKKKNTEKKKRNAKQNHRFSKGSGNHLRCPSSVEPSLFQGQGSSALFSGAVQQHGQSGQCFSLVSRPPCSPSPQRDER